MLKVFPTETVARSFVLYTAKQNPDTAVFEDEFVSWDTFCTLCSEIPDKRKATYTDRRVFAEKYLNSSSRFASLLAKEIVYYKKALAKANLPEIKREELANAVQAYESYLSERSLYEEAFIERDFSKAPKGTVIYFASSINDADINEAVKYCKTIESDKTLPVLKVYRNTIGEIRDTFREVRKLLEKGTRACDIALTCVNPDSCMTYIKEEAEKRNIELSFMFGKKLSQYPSGMFFKALKEVIEDDFSFESMKKILLNPCYPFKDRDLIKNILEKAVDYRISDGGKNAANYKYKFSKAGNTQELEFINKFSEVVSCTVLSLDVEHIKLSLRRLQDLFFEGASWDSTGNTEDIMAFQRCMEVLSSVEEARYDGDNPYEVFADVLENTVYVPLQSSEGIKVYRYPLSCGLMAQNHFVIGLSDDDTRVKRTYTPFLQNDAFSQEIGDNIIRSYCYNAQNLVLSCSETTYESEVCVPSVFIKEEKTVKTEPSFKDSFWQEEQFFLSGGSEKIKPVFNQVENFNHALETTLDYDNRNKITRPESSIKLSASSLNVFKNCPFAWLIQSGLGINEQDFEIRMDDPRIIGELLHSTFEEYLKKIKSFDNGFHNKDLFVSLFFEKVDGFAKSENGMDKLWSSYIKNKYKDVLVSFFTAKESTNLINSELVSTEKYFRLENSDYTISGFIDLIMKTPEGSYIIIDLKKNELPSDPLQLVLYSKAVENPAMGAFYSIEGERYKVAWKDSNTLKELSDDLDSFVKEASEKIKKGEFTFAENPKSCERCSYRRICRRRYVIK